MEETRYLIKEAANLVGVEAHVLRYWEEELKMDIHRNEMGHRYYTERDIEILSKVRDLKEKGLQLKAIRSCLDKRRQELQSNHSGEQKHESPSSGNELVSVKQTILSNEAKMEQFQQLMVRILSTAIKENNELIGETAGEYAANAVVTQMNGMTKEQEARAEARYQKLDQTLREIQRARQEAAAANMRPVDRRKQKRLKRKNQQGTGVPFSSTEETEQKDTNTPGGEA